MPRHSHPVIACSQTVYNSFILCSYSSSIVLLVRNKQPSGRVTARSKTKGVNNMALFVVTYYNMNTGNDRIAKIEIDECAVFGEITELKLYHIAVDMAFAGKTECEGVGKIEFIAW